MYNFDCAVRLVSPGWDSVGCPSSNQRLHEHKGILSVHQLESAATPALQPEVYFQQLWRLV